MRIALINENSQAAKNEMIYANLKKVAESKGHTVDNYGMYSADDNEQLTYVQNGILAAILLNSGACDFVVTGCGTGEGAMLALNSFPNVLCGHVVDPSDAYMFMQINDGNAIALPFAKGFGWGAELFITSMKMGLSSGLYLLNSIPNFIVTFGNLSVVGFCMILISLQSKPKKQKIVFLLIVSYFILLMLCGRRSENVAYICILSFFFLKCYREKVNIKTLTLIIILGILFLNVLYAIVYSRQRNEGQNISNFITAFQYVLIKKNIFIESLREYGNTGYTAIAVISNWLPMFGATNGLSILYSLTAIIPNIIGVAGKLTSLGNFALILQKTTGILSSEYLNIGGSLFAELFFNFGIIGGCISCLIIGYFVGLLSEKLNFYIANGCYFKIAYYIATYISIIYWIRDRIAGGVRYAVWGAFLVYISQKFFLRRRSK